MYVFQMTETQINYSKSFRLQKFNIRKRPVFGAHITDSSSLWQVLRAPRERSDDIFADLDEALAAAD